MYACDKDVESVAMRFEDHISGALDKLKHNKMVANPKKFQVMFLGLKQHQEFSLETENKSIDMTRSVKLLGINVDDELKFDKHVKTMCQNVSRKISAFSRVVPYIYEKKGKILYHTFIMSNFNYCPLIWIFCGKTQNKEIDRVHKRALRILLDDYTSSFGGLLRRIGDIRAHVKTLRNLMIEICKCLSCENPSFMWNIFQRKELTYNLRSGSIFMLPQAKTTTYGTSSLTLEVVCSGTAYRTL